MLDLNSLLVFSHTHCVAICAVLVPLNLLTTLLTLTLVGLHRPRLRVQQASSLAITGSLLMVLHVLTWLVVGVVRIQTFVLFSLGLSCLVLSMWALWHPRSLRRIIRFGVTWVRPALQSVVQRVEVS